MAGARGDEHPPVVSRKGGADVETVNTRENARKSPGAQGLKMGEVV